MIRKYAALFVAIVLVALVATACIVRTGPPRRGYRSEPPPRAEKHKKHKKHDHR